MLNALLVSIGGVIGSLLRYYTVIFFGLVTRAFPFGVLCVNVIGSFLVGICAVYCYQYVKASTSELWGAFLITGILGGYTTFSSFSLNTFTMIYDGRLLLALVNMVANVVLCVLATGLGFYLMTKLGSFLR